MKLKFEFVWSEGMGVEYGEHIQDVKIGIPLVGIKYQKKLPFSVELSRKELLYLVEHPLYLRRLANALNITEENL